MRIAALASNWLVFIAVVMTVIPIPGCKKDDHVRALPSGAQYTRSLVGDHLWYCRHTFTSCTHPQYNFDKEDTQIIAVTVIDDTTIIFSNKMLFLKDVDSSFNSVRFFDGDYFNTSNTLTYYYLADSITYVAYRHTGVCSDGYDSYFTPLK